MQGPCPVSELLSNSALMADKFQRIASDGWDIVMELAVLVFQLIGKRRLFEFRHIFVQVRHLHHQVTKKLCIFAVVKPAVNHGVDQVWQQRKECWR